MNQPGGCQYIWLDNRAKISCKFLADLRGRDFPPLSFAKTWFIPSISIALVNQVAFRLADEVKTKALHDDLGLFPRIESLCPK